MPAGYYAGPEDPLVSADFAGWWRRGFTLLQATWRPMALVHLIWVLPFFVLNVLMAGSDTYSYTTTTDFETFDWQTEFVAPFLLMAPIGIVIGLLSIVGQLAALDLLVQRATGRPISVGAALRTGLRRLLPVLGWEILAGLLAVVGFVLCILPGVYVVAALLVLPVVVLLERGQGIGRAFQLFHADFGAALARIATIVGVYLGFAVVESIFSGMLGPAAVEGSVVVTIVLAVIGGAFSIAANLVVSPLLLTAYADMRARREPFSTAYLSG